MTRAPCGAGPEVAVTMSCPAWHTGIPGAEGLCREAAGAALAAVGLAGAGEVSVVLADDAFVRDLNARHRGRDVATDVLSFPTDERPTNGAGGPALLGDVVVAYETTRREAEEQGKTLVDHLRHLIVHGTLHLLGYDHATDGGAELMERMEASALASLGIADPYGAALAPEPGGRRP